MQEGGNNFISEEDFSAAIQKGLPDLEEEEEEGGKLSVSLLRLRAKAVAAWKIGKRE